MRRAGDERGLAMAVEAVVILPVLVLFIGLVISLARIAIADGRTMTPVNIEAAPSPAASVRRAPLRRAYSP